MKSRRVLYRMYDTRGVLLYVGVTFNVPDRMRNHAREKFWWDDVYRITIERFDPAGDDTAEKAELQAIKEEHPLWNVAGRSSGAYVGTAMRQAVLESEVVQRWLEYVENLHDYGPPRTFCEVWFNPTDIRGRVLNAFGDHAGLTPQQWHTILDLADLPHSRDEWDLNDPDVVKRVALAADLAAAVAGAGGIPNHLRTEEGRRAAEEIVRERVAAIFPDVEEG